jgi:hypothetical protein
MSDEAILLQNDHFKICFINTDQKPIGFMPFDNYKYYRYDDGKIIFQQLFTERYLYQESIVEIEVWKPIKIKKHCENALINMIDSMKAIREFIVKPFDCKVCVLGIMQPLEDETYECDYCHAKSIVKPK